MPTKRDESKGQFLLSQFKEKSAIIQSSSEFRSRSSTTSDGMPKLDKIEPGFISSTTVEPPPAARARQSLRGANDPPPESSRTQSQPHTPQPQQSPALPQHTPNPAPGDRPSASEKSLDKKKVVSASAGRWDKRNTSQSERTQKSASASPVSSAQDSREGNLSPTQPSPALNPIPEKGDPAASKSPKLLQFANSLSLLTAALYKATELLPQVALRDLEAVLENDWMVDDMEKMVVGVVSLVNGRDGEKQWRSGGGNGKL